MVQRNPDPEDGIAVMAEPPPPDTTGTAAALAAAALLAACGGGGSGGSGSAGDPATPAGTPAPAPVPATPPSRRDAARFLTQASFGPSSAAQIDTLVAQGLDPWLTQQFTTPQTSHFAYLDAQRGRDQKPGEVKRLSEEMSYEALWQQWLYGPDQLRARVTWALMQIFVISNIAPDIRPEAMSSYTDMLGRNAFGSWRQLLEDVTLHPAMGYYLNMLRSEKENPAEGTHPNENYAREVLQLFSIGLVQLNPDGTPKLDAAGKTQPTYGEDVVKGFAKAFSGWSFGGQDTSNPNKFWDVDENQEAVWTQPMKAWASHHSPGDKLLLDGKSLPAGQMPEKDMADALDAIYRHPNVAPFFSKQLIQRLVTSNPSPAYVGRVAAVFENDGKGTRGNLQAVVRAVLLDAEARGDAPAASVAKLREPVIRFANLLRALNAKSPSGDNRIDYLDSSDDALGQSPLLSPSVFNFYSPGYRPAGPIAASGQVAPEFQITGETTVAASLNFFAGVIRDSGYGWDSPHRLNLDFTALVPLAADPPKLIDQLDLLFFNLGMSAGTRNRLTQLVQGYTAADDRVRAALLVTFLSPDFVVQR